MKSTIPAILGIICIVAVAFAGCTGTGYQNPAATTSPAPVAGATTPSGNQTCLTDADCVPATCCHPDSCTAATEAPSCKDTMCTMICSGPLDCGAGRCGCVDGTCSVVPASGGVTPMGTAIQAGNIVVTDAQNGATVDMNAGNVITLKLAENPTTGFRWNLTVTPGLKVMNDTYVPSDKTGTMVGSGGTRIWEIATVMPGVQAINATYLRSWEPATGNETAFAMTVNVA